jgi:hypothetical protein
VATTAPTNESIRNHAAFIWSVADLLRGDYKQSEYGKVILPMVVLRRLDCVLEATKQAVLDRHNALKGSGIENVEPVLCAVSGEQFFNTSKLDLPKLIDDPANIDANLHAYIQSFSRGAREVVDRFDFAVQIERLNKSKLLYLVVSRFCEIDLHPDAVSNLEMGYLYEELIRRFSELSNETAGEHFTPREVIRLMVNLLFIEDDQALAKPGVVRTMYDPACGIGGMLSIAEDHLRALNPGARLDPPRLGEGAPARRPDGRRPPRGDPARSHREASTGHGCEALQSVLGAGELRPRAEAEAEQPPAPALEPRRPHRHRRRRLTMAAIDNGKQRVARDPNTNRCSALNRRGMACGAWSVRGEAFCFAHLIGEEEWQALGQQGGRSTARKHARRKAARELLRQGRSVPLDAHEKALADLESAQQKLRQLVAEGRMSPDELPRILRPVR